MSFATGATSSIQPTRWTPILSRLALVVILLTTVPMSGCSELRPNPEAQKATAESKPQQQRNGYVCGLSGFGRTATCWKR